MFDLKIWPIVYFGFESINIFHPRCFCCTKKHFSLTRQSSLLPLLGNCMKSKSILSLWRWAKTELWRNIRAFPAVLTFDSRRLCGETGARDFAEKIINNCNVNYKGTLDSCNMLLSACNFYWIGCCFYVIVLGVLKACPKWDRTLNLVDILPQLKHLSI